ncbi:DUF2867 domain-containing protein [Streptomyces alkaliphilus]|uniref:DUF2867 domain-containing protein n=1 Tax=Streptomyces alkaliphilus TaxID=1472722 RepID=UPI001887ABD7|nr:DUF2867 domain-containing protein [Streptomyces alkaliphilus]
MRPIRKIRTVRNVHERSIAAPAATVGALLDRLAAEDDPLWPAPAWPALRLDRPLGPGATGGHGPIRYTVEEYEPGRRVRFRFEQLGGGYHELSVIPRGADRCLLRHVLDAATPGMELITWPLAVRWMHDAVLEELLDNAQRAAGDVVTRPARRSPWVRLLHRMLWPRPRAVDPPAAAELLRGAPGRVDFIDAWRVELHPFMPRDPEYWRREFLRPPPMVRALMVLRQGFVGLLGIDRDGSRDGFPVLARDEHELLAGTDAEHLNFRISLLVAEGGMTLTTVTELHNRRGRLYFAVVRRFHPFVVRAMMRRAHRATALRSTPAARVG